MPMLRPLAALVVASTVAACAASGPDTPDEGAPVAAGASAAGPFAGSVYPVPPSHHAAPTAAEGVAHEAPHGAAPADSAVNHTLPAPADAAPHSATAPSAAPVVEPAPAVVPPAPATPEAEDHSGHR